MGMSRSGLIASSACVDTASKPVATGKGDSGDSGDWMCNRRGMRGRSKAAYTFEEGLGRRRAYVGEKHEGGLIFVAPKEGGDTAENRESAPH